MLPPQGQVSGKLPRQDPSSKNPPLSRLAASTPNRSRPPLHEYVAADVSVINIPSQSTPTYPRQLITLQGAASDNPERLDLAPVGNVMVGGLRLPQPFFLGGVPIVGEGREGD
jgi:hypothetical protein